jgi:tetratricopeptide (TPR) repeat protein
MDPENPVVRLCAEGIRAEADGRQADARDLFRRAWESATDDYEACVAAHYLARHQPTAEETLRWNRECLERADRVGDERVRGFYASLHLNMAAAHRELGHLDEAREHFEQAAACVEDAPSGQYGDWNRFAVADGLRSTGGLGRRPADGLLADLLARLCTRRDLKALGLILPAYLGDLGTEDDRVRLVTALHMVHAARWLPAEDQDAVGRALTALGTA